MVIDRAVQVDPGCQRSSQLTNGRPPSLCLSSQVRSQGASSSCTFRHTLYLSFLLHRQDFRKPNFTPKKTTKGTKNTKNVSEKVKYMHFFHSIWKNLHLTENFYTDMSVVSVTNMRYALTPLDTPGVPLDL